MPNLGKHRDFHNFVAVRNAPQPIIFGHRRGEVLSLLPRALANQFFHNL
jgi:hypothetical protein